LNGIVIPSLITNLSGPIGSAFATAQMAKFGTDAVAAASVIGRITPVAFAGLYGLSGAVGPIASQNFGAGNYQRVRQTLIESFKFSCLYVIPVAILIYLLQQQLVETFGLKDEAAELLEFYTTFLTFAVAMWLTRRVENGQSIEIGSLRTRWHHYRAIAPGVQHRGH